MQPDFRDAEIPQVSAKLAHLETNHSLVPTYGFSNFTLGYPVQKNTSSFPFLNAFKLMEKTHIAMAEQRLVLDGICMYICQDSILSKSKLKQNIYCSAFQNSTPALSYI